jgi:hypothetical protein
MTSHTLTYVEKDVENSSPIYLSKSGQESISDVQKTTTRVTILGSTAGTVQNYNAQGDTILLPTPTDDA